MKLDKELEMTHLIAPDPVFEPSNRGYKKHGWHHDDAEIR